MKDKQPASKPSQGANPAKKKATFGTSGAREVGKDSTNVHDSRRDSKPKAWSRKKTGHQDQKNAVAQGGSVN